VASQGYFEWGSAKPNRQKGTYHFKPESLAAGGARLTAYNKSAAGREAARARQTGKAFMLGRKHSPKTKAKMSLARKGKSNPLNSGPKPNISAGKKGRCSERQRAALAKGWATRGPEHYRAMGVKSMEALKKRIAFTDRRGRVFHLRSGYEVTFAEHLDARLLTWDYEPRVVKLSDGRAYVPDFFVHEWDSFVEVKGWSGWRLDKVRQAQADGLAIAVIGKPEITAIRASHGSR